MRSKSIKNGYLEVDGQKQYVWSGEIQYFRLEKEYWKTLLDGLKEANFNTLSTYVPWNWHEYEKGKYDFTGLTHPSRDLIGFLDMVKEYGFNLIIKGGPHIHAEYLNGGIPLWVLEENPQILSLGPDGTPLQKHNFYPAITYLHPDYMKLVKEWYGKFAEVMLPYDNIIMWQIDNEISYHITFFTYMNGQLYTGDYNPFLVKKGLYQKFLKDKYETIEALNEKYKESNLSFEEVDAPTDPVKKGDLGAHNKSSDYLDFRCQLVGWYARELIEILYGFGVKGPFSIDDPLLQFDTTWRDLYEAIKDDRWEAVVGYTHYSGSSLEEGMGNHLRRIELTRASGSPIVSNHEMQAGDMYFMGHWKQLSSDYDILWKTGIGYGNNMINLYWFCDGYNFNNYEHLIPELNLNSPMSRYGEKRTHYYIAQKIGKFLKENPWIVETKVVYDMAVGYYHNYAKALKFNNQIGVFRDEFTSSGIGGGVGSFIDLMGVCNINFKLLNLKDSLSDLGDVPNNKMAVTLYDCLDGRIQQSLLDFAEAGGHLILQRCIPTQDEDFNPCRILYDAIGIKNIDVIKYNPETAYVVNRAQYGDFEFCICDDLWTYDLYDEEYTTDLLSYPNKKVCGFTKNIGKGKISLLGFVPQVFMHASREFARRYFGKRSVDGLLVYERTIGQKSLYTVCNMLDEVQELEYGDTKYSFAPRHATFITRDTHTYTLWD
jgi:beta-galactosidase